MLVNTYIPMNRFMHRGRFVGHNGAVCALEMKGNVMATGSRDRLIKVRFRRRLQCV